MYTKISSWVWVTLISPNPTTDRNLEIQLIMHAQKRCGKKISKGGIFYLKILISHWWRQWKDFHEWKKYVWNFFHQFSQDKISTSVHCVTHITNACGHEPKQHRFLTYYSQILYIKIHRFRVKQVLLMPEQCPNLRHLCRHVMFNVREHTKLVKGIKNGIERTSQTPVTASARL